MATVDYLIIAGYLLFALGVGVVMSRRASGGPESFFLGGRTLPWWMIGVSMVATSFASDTPLFVTELTRDRGIQRIWWVFVSVLPLIFGIFLFSRLWRRAAVITDAEFYDLRYSGPSAAFMRGFRAFFSGVVQNLITIGWVTLGMSSVIAVMTPFNQTAAIGLCILVALVYATTAGFYGVVITDLLQFFIAIGSMVAVAVLAVYHFGGMQAVLDAVHSQPGYGPSVTTMFPDFTTLNADAVSLVVLVTLLWWNDANGYNMQRMSACRDERDAVKATIFYAVFQCARPWMWIVVAFVSIGLFPVIAEPMTDTHAYPLVVQEVVGAGLRGLLVTAFLAAFMSTIDTHLNWGASYLMTDVYSRWINPTASRRRYMAVTRAVVVGLMLAGAALVPLMPSVTSAMEFLALIMVGSGIVWVARWFWWRVNAWSEISALAAGLLCSAANQGLNLLGPSVTLAGVPWVGVRFEFKVAVFTAIVLPISLAVTLLTPPVDRAKLEAFCARVNPGGFWNGIDSGDRAGLGRVLSPGTLRDVTAGVMLCYGVSLGIGFAILLRFTAAGLCVAIAAVGALGVWSWYRREAVRLARPMATGAEPDLPVQQSGVVGQPGATG